MKKRKLKKYLSSTENTNFMEELDLDVMDAEEDLYDDPNDLLNAEVWEYMNEQDDVCLK